MIYYEIRRTTGEVIASTIQNYPQYIDLAENKNQVISERNVKSIYKVFEKVSVWLIIKDEQDLINSTRLSRRATGVYANVADDLFNFYLEKIKVHSHTLRAIQGKMKQKIDGLAEKKDFRARTYRKSKEKIAKLISSNLIKTADIICQLNKRVSEIDAHIDGFDVLYMGDQRKGAKKKVNIKKVILNIISPFLLDIENKGVSIVYTFSNEYALDNLIELDYRMFNLSYCNFLDNLLKYTLPNSKVTIGFTKNGSSFAIKITMMSIRIDKDEKEMIFDEGYSGRHAQQDAGDGIGMSVIRKALRLTDLNIRVECDYSVSRVMEERKYVKNTFFIESIPNT